MNENILIVLILLFGGFSIRLALIMTGQNWAKSYQQTIAFLVLPFVTFIITKTISGNISLSLGMIGAMSIVRFRNPVKSALELVMYFALITLGIAANVKYQWAVSLIVVIILIIILVNLFNIISKKFNRSFFTTSFHEGTALHLLEVYSSEKIELLRKHENLKIFLVRLVEVSALLYNFHKYLSLPHALSFLIRKSFVFKFKVKPSAV